MPPPGLAALLGKVGTRVSRVSGTARLSILVGPGRFFLRVQLIRLFFKVVRNLIQRIALWSFADRIGQFAAFASPRTEAV
jgi:hypothetical protein